MNDGLIARDVAALWRSTHPGPTLVVTALAALLAWASGLSGGRLLILTAAVFVGQVSVGLSNDAIDVHRDRRSGRTDKPLVDRPALLPVAWVAAATALAAAVALSVPLSAEMAFAHAVTLVSAWAYNAGLKSTPFSVVPFVVSFGLFPSLVTLAVTDPALAPPWVTFAGGAFGVAVHLTNVVPDLDDDARTGVRGLPHRLGARASLVVAFATVAVAACAVFGFGTLGSGDPPGVPAIGIAAAAVATCVWGAWRAIRGSRSRASFRLVMTAALLLAAQLAVTGLGVR